MDRRGDRDRRWRGRIDAGTAQRGLVIALRGDLGAGKTHLAKSFGAGLGVTETIVYTNTYSTGSDTSMRSVARRASRAALPSVALRASMASVTSVFNTLTR